MAKVKAFFDTNVLLYSDDARDAVKQHRAADVLESHFRANTGAVSMQILQEYFYRATTKLKLDVEIARRRAFFFSNFTVVQPSIEDFWAAIDLHRMHQISFWDALVVRMALRSGAQTLFTEDLQHGRRFDNLQIVNPFL